MADSKDTHDGKHFTIDWNLIDWGSSVDMNLPWHRKDIENSVLAVDVQSQTGEASDVTEGARASDCVNRALPWLRNAEIDWSPGGRKEASNITNRVLSYAHYANQFEDINTVIELMLTEARDATRSDGGTFYLITPEGNLRIAYFQNATLSKGGDGARNHYVNVEMPINDRSIAGYVALTKKPLNIPNVYQIPDDTTYKFNKSLDESSGYTTISMLTMPVIGNGGNVMAVLQLINSLDDDGLPKAYDELDVIYSELLAFQSTPYLTKSIMTRRLIETMLRLSEMRDPLETGAHVNRVGAFSAEIYERWATKLGVSREEMMIEKDTLRLAAMLHDIGKLLIPDAIIKKPGKLTDEEYSVMKTHCALGAKMYSKGESALERVAYDITLHHHQRWDGKGYTGTPDVPVRSGTEIPIYARITSVADVLDALAFSRSYKDAWKFDDVMEELKRSSGTQFDPDVVDAAVDISETLRAIVERYK